MTAERKTSKRFGAALLGLVATGCAQVVGIEDFTLADTSSASAGSGVSSSSGPPADLCNDVHGCKRASAENSTGLSVVHVAFAASGYTYACIVVDAGATIQFDGMGYTFEDVPIAGGVFPTAEMNSPIKNPTPANVTMASFILGSECSYPYFSPLLQKVGVIFTQ